MIGIHNAIIGYRPAGLGTVGDSWSMGGNPTIQKQPKQSLELPRKTRVGQDNKILDDIGNAYDRIKEAILPYARGIDPMVSVMMQNTNGGQQASLPYKLGVFRPPVQRQEDLMPLSRLPRQSTSVTQWTSNNQDPSYAERNDRVVVEHRPDLPVIEGRIFASARPHGVHEPDRPAPHGLAHETRFYEKHEPDIERQVAAPLPEISNLGQPLYAGAETGATRKLLLPFGQSHDDNNSKTKIQAGNVDPNRAYLPHVRVENGREPINAVRNELQLRDVTPYHQAQYGSRPQVAGAELQHTPIQIEYTTRPVAQRRDKDAINVHFRGRETHRIAAAASDGRMGFAYSERLLPTVRDRVVSRQSFTVR